MDGVQSMDENRLAEVQTTALWSQVDQPKEDPS